MILFWKIVLAVHDRRHTSNLYMPVAISIQELRESVMGRLKAKHDEETFPTISIPSGEWIRLQFWPKNVYTKTALQYTGRFNVSYKVQSRLLRKSHTIVLHYFVILGFLLSSFVILLVLYLPTTSTKFQLEK